MPRRAPTSSFEHPAAMSDTIVRCRSVSRGGVASGVVVVMGRFKRPSFEGTIPRRVYPRV
jgi:hypothetical protein